MNARRLTTRDYKHTRRTPIDLRRWREVGIGLAIGLAVAYVVPIEAIVVGVIWSNGDRWLPGQLLSALAHGGTGDASYGHVLVTLAV